MQGLLWGRHGGFGIARFRYRVDQTEFGSFPNPIRVADLTALNAAVYYGSLNSLKTLVESNNGKGIRDLY